MIVISLENHRIKAWRIVAQLYLKWCVVGVGEAGGILQLKHAAEEIQTRRVDRLHVLG